MNKKQSLPKFIKKCTYDASKDWKNKSISLDLKGSYHNNKIKFIKKNQQYLQIDKEKLKQFQVLGMVKKQIFCIYHPMQKLYGSVDQHAMHERVRYEYYSRSIQQLDLNKFKWRNIEKGLLERVPTLAKGKAKHHKLIYVCKKQLINVKGGPLTIQKYGICLKIQQSGEVFMHSFHEILGKRLEDDVLKQIGIQMLQLQQKNSSRIPSTLDNIIAQHSCKSAIKFGDEVTKQWCIDLLFNASLCDFPWKCVHGRPTVHFQCYSANPEPRSYILS